MRLKVFRFDPKTKISRYQAYELELPREMTVLAALFHIRDRLDGTLSFRYSCRGAVCGSCAMLINKVPRLACRTRLPAMLAGETVRLAPFPAIIGGEGWEPGKEVLLEPLPHLPVLKDLVVDMRPFFEKYRAVRPYLISAEGGSAEGGGPRMDIADVEELGPYTNCILCAACLGACPVNAREPGYLGPAALAKLYRFSIDPRDAEGPGRLGGADSAEGWRGCRFHLNCRTVCPMGVQPNVAIGNARAAIRNEVGK